MRTGRVLPFSQQAPRTTGRATAARRRTALDGTTATEVPGLSVHPAARPGVPDEVLDLARLESVRSTGLLDVVAVETLDSLTRLAATLLDAPLSFLTVVDEERSYWASCTGVGDGSRENTVEESFCQYVIVDVAPVVIDDAATHPRTRDNPSVASMGVRAWAGYPVLDAEGRALGSFCVVDTEPRAWTDKQVELLGVLAAAASAHVQLLTRVDREVEARETTQQLQAASDGLARMAAVALELGAVDTMHDLARVAVEHGLPALGAKGGVIGVRDDQHGVLRLLRGTGPIPTGFEVLPLDHGLPMVQVAMTGETSLLPPTQARAEADRSSPEVRRWAGDGTWACCPMRGGDRLLGSVAATWSSEVTVTEREVALLRLFTALCTQTLERMEMQAEQRRAATEVRQMSETLQRSLLTTPTVHDHLSVAVRYLPAASEAQIGGDWYDAFVTTSGLLTLVIGDISGHDRMAAAAMGQLRNLVRGMAFDSPDGPASLLGRLDAAMHGLQMDTLATALVARVEQDPDDAARGVHRLRWSSAGHLPVLVRGPDGSVRVLDERADLMLGVDPTTAREERVVELEDGAMVLLYTDGLVERRDASLDRCIRELAERFERVGAGSPERVCDELLAGVHDDQHRDDLAMLVVQFGTSPG